MGQYIDKATVVAEIERRITNHNKELQHASEEDFVSSWASDEENQKLALTSLLPFLNTLEVKEVDLEKELKNLIGNVGQCDRKLAKHFFELGLAQKGEKLMEISLAKAELFLAKSLKPDKKDGKDILIANGTFLEFLKRFEEEMTMK